MLRNPTPRRALARAVTLATAALALAAGTVAAAGVSLASTAAQAQNPPPPVPVNLHPRYLNVLGQAKVGGPSRYLPQSAPAQANPATSCIERDCPVTYHGGPVEHTPKVYLLLWGPNWTIDPAQEGSYNYLGSFLAGLGVAPQDTWSPITSQYNDTTGSPAFGSSVYAGAYQDTITPPIGVTPNDLAAEAYALQQYAGISDLVDSQIIIAAQSGTTYSDGFGTLYCAWHNYVVYNGSAQTPFINLPYQPDADCGTSYGPNAGFSIGGGHEYAEVTTDPYITGWYDPNDLNDGGGEIGDKCAYTDPVTGNPDIGSVTLSTGTFAEQPLWSNSVYSQNGDGCTMAVPDTVTVTNPGNQSSTAGTAASLQIHATSGGGYPLTYNATGLPPGLAINTSTGLISGTPTTVGSYSPAVTATDSTGGTGSATFTWTVNPAPPPSYPSGIVTGYFGCLDDYAWGTANGTPVDLYTCVPQANQQWTLQATQDPSTGLYTGELVSKSSGLCVNDAGYGGTGSKVILWSCVGSSNEVWTYWPTYREYSVTYGGHTYCMNDPGYSTTPGTKQIVWTCPDTANERYSLPH